MSEERVGFCPIDPNNQFTLLHSFFNNKKIDKSLQIYAKWLDTQSNPPKSYREHPIASEQQIDVFKKDFHKSVGLSLGAYLRIKRAYHILNESQMNTSEVPAHSLLSSKTKNQCEFSYINTPVGSMLAIFFADKLCLLEFLERKMLETELKQIIKEKQCHFQFKKTAESDIAKELQQQLDDYFAGKRKEFDISLDTIGTEFQQHVWQTLQTIDYGTTISYQDEAEQMNKPTAMRAVANANGKNKISIIIPCHRVIRKSGDLGGYGGGLWRKRYLLELESSSIN